MDPDACRRKRRAIAALATALLSGSAATACGVFFPWQPLGHRDAAMRDLPVDSFDFEAARLVARPDPRLPTDIGWSDGTPPPYTDSEEARTLTAPQLALVKAMRASPDARSAESVGQGLPVAVRSYVSGAVAFAHDDMAGAIARFRAVPSAPAGGPDRSSWARYMLGRALGWTGDAAAAATAFRALRAQVAAGTPDPLGLAVASLGEEARAPMQASGLPVQPDDPPASRPDPERLSALRRAVLLYAQQASYRSESGESSLKWIAEALLTDRPDRTAWLEAAVRDTLLRRLLIAYALAASGPAPIGTWDNEDSSDALPYAGQLNGTIPGAPASATLLARLTPLLEAGGVVGEDAGRLAAVAYLRGRWDLAGRLAALSTGPLGAWVHAKLTLQDFDDAATIRAYDLAVRALAADPDAMTPEAGARLRIEPAVLAVGRGDFEQAMAILYPEATSYWGDVSWLAERVLTTDELARFVAGHVPAVGLLPKMPSRGYWGDPSSMEAPRSLRELLARRMMRDGRMAQAAALFTSADHRAWAEAYARAVDRSGHAFWRTDRARASWDAAVIQRAHGMELFGTELRPDMAAIGGEFDSGWASDVPPSDGYVTIEELRRVDASRPRPDLRFHYRYLAVARAEQAAADLPPRSQAYAAVLCRAARWMGQSRDDPELRRLYRLYVAHGAAAPFASSFGGRCPAPDFAAAARLRWTEEPRHLLAPVRRHARLVAGAVLAVVLLLITPWLGRRRRA